MLITRQVELNKSFSNYARYFIKNNRPKEDLFDFMAALSTEELSYFVTLSDHSGSTLLHLLLQYKHNIDSVKKLLDDRLDTETLVKIFTSTNKDGKNPLMIAIGCHSDTISILLTVINKFDDNTKDIIFSQKSKINDGMNALLIAIGKGTYTEDLIAAIDNLALPTIIKILLAKESNGRNALMYALDINSYYAIPIIMIIDKLNEDIKKELFQAAIKFAADNSPTALAIMLTTINNLDPESRSFIFKHACQGEDHILKLITRWDFARFSAKQREVIFLTIAQAYFELNLIDQPTNKELLLEIIYYHAEFNWLASVLNNMSTLETMAAICQEGKVNLPPLNYLFKNNTNIVINNYFAGFLTLLFIKSYSNKVSIDFSIFLQLIAKIDAPHELDEKMCSEIGLFLKYLYDINQSQGIESDYINLVLIKRFLIHGDDCAQKLAISLDQENTNVADSDKVDVFALDVALYRPKIVPADARTAREQHQWFSLWKQNIQTKSIAQEPTSPSLSKSL